MSFTQKEIIEEILSWQKTKSDEVQELKRMTTKFAENERTKRAKEVAFGERLEGLRRQFSSFFSNQPQEAKV
ncbi:MAG: hypothetical protein COT74_01660 [Bdellovibrionales bacterium CG10_big_fil_rev_8_21_14_0_10_45_34]|nr:MAG: hypothetical protein COT74_01660 [Bdellovibrionales bacterium CG10_big_fil_rev_8_21_14_0_10_45_34]